MMVGDVNRAGEPMRSLMMNRPSSASKVTSGGSGGGTEGQLGVVDRDRDGRGAVGVFADLDTEDAFDGLAFEHREVGGSSRRCR